MTKVGDKKADLAGPGIGNYDELEEGLAQRLRVAVGRERDAAGHLCREALHRREPLQGTEPDDGYGPADRQRRKRRQRHARPRRRPHADQFHITNDYDKHPIDAQVVQAATKWKRMALKQFGMKPGEGICTDMRAVRRTTSSITTIAAMSISGTGSA